MIRSTTIGHPHRDPETGLVPESEAYDTADGDEDGFGDGRSIVAVECGVSGSRLHVLTRIRPTEDQAPRDSVGRPMTCYLAIGEELSLDTLDAQSASDEAVAWLVARGINATYARERVTSAFSAESAAARRIAAIERTTAAVLAAAGSEALAAEATQFAATLHRNPLLAQALAAANASVADLDPVEAELVLSRANEALAYRASNPARR